MMLYDEYRIVGEGERRVALSCAHHLPSVRLEAAAVTPAFHLCESRVEQNLALFRECFPGAAIHYAIKANSSPEVLRTLHDAGSCFEVASLGELHELQAACGDVDPSRMLFGTSVKPGASIAAFHALGIDRFAFDSLAELHRIAVNAPGARVLVRVIVGHGDSVFNMSEKFGVNRDEAVGLLLAAGDLGLQPYGLSFNVGSQTRQATAWADAVDHIAPVLRELAGQGIKLEALNLGGGYPQAYPGSDVSDLQEIAAATRPALERLPYQPQLILEPGRALVADAVTLTTTIISRVTRGQREWLYLDAGVYNALFEALACQGSTRYRVCVEGVEQNMPRAVQREFVLAGPTGDGLDVIDREVLLPADIAEGDRLVLHDTGAYASCVASSFNGFAPAVTSSHRLSASCQHCASASVATDLEAELDLVEGVS
jgi:ornithine decarboxylase